MQSTKREASNSMIQPEITHLMNVVRVKESFQVGHKNILNKKASQVSGKLEVS